MPSRYCPSCGIGLAVEDDYDIVECPCCGKSYFGFELLDDSDAAQAKRSETQHTRSAESERLSAAPAEETSGRRQKADKHERIKFFKGLIFCAVVVAVCLFIFSRCSNRHVNANNVPFDRYLKTSGFSRVEKDAISMVLLSEVISCEDLLGYNSQYDPAFPKEGVAYIDCIEQSSVYGIDVSEDENSNSYLLKISMQRDIMAEVVFRVYKNSDTWSLEEVWLAGTGIGILNASVDAERYGSNDAITEAGVPEDDRYLALNGLLLVALGAMAPNMFY